ncbi:hypothetical protein [Qipengyuania vesicularis]|uniref:hypothetical protein n=1 Tax=Qipengyuania vesicularis TaxID=2867232 RepID=UPI001C8802D0|nr:hypothetical protein [Qipengyuania vesicularis]MBX7527234.1 hypothetical protein [Qipengyuania vesicularis]
MTRSHASIAYLVFLALFAAFKYFSAAPAAFSAGYLVSVIVLVLLTGVIPYFLARFAAGRAGGTAGRWVAALAVALLACCAGYAGYFKLFIEPQNLGVSMGEVALRGIYAGTIQGVLAALYATARRQ